MRAIPPATPIIIFINGSLAIVRSPRARSIMRENSMRVCPNEKSKPVFAPVFAPWEIVAKNIGPGARAPEAVIRMTVIIKVKISMILIWI